MQYHNSYYDYQLDEFRKIYTDLKDELRTQGHQVAGTRKNRRRRVSRKRRKNRKTKKGGRRVSRKRRKSKKKNKYNSTNLCSLIQAGLQHQFKLL